MTRWWIVLALAACNKRQEVPMAHGSGSAVVAPADAQPADMAMPDAAADAAVATGPLPVDTDKLLDEEAIGPLHFGMKQAEVVKVLGAPKKKTAAVEEGATGEFASSWTWPGVTLEMMSDTRTGPAHVRLISVTAPTAHATRRGIRIGSKLREVAAAYPKSDEGGDDPTQFLVGSPYGGLLFVLEQDVVTEILLGPMAF